MESFYIGATADGGASYCSGEKTLVGECGTNSMAVYSGFVDDEIIYVIDDNLPYFQFDDFSSTSFSCPTISYEIYGNKEDNFYHPLFNSVPEVISN